MIVKKPNFGPSALDACYAIWFRAKQLEAAALGRVSTINASSQPKK